MKLHSIFIYVVRFFFLSLPSSFTSYSVSSSYLLLIFFFFQAMIFLYTFFFIFHRISSIFTRNSYIVCRSNIHFPHISESILQYFCFCNIFFSSISTAPARNFISNQCSVLRELNVCYKVEISFQWVSFVVCSLSFLSFFRNFVMFIRSIH